MRGRGDDCFDPTKNPALKREIRAAREAMIPENYIQRVIQFATPGLYRDRLPHLRHRLGFGGLSDGRRPELEQLGARHQRLPRVRSQPTADWNLIRRTDGKVAKTLHGARAVGAASAHAAWASADPGMQFDTTINDWHTCPESGRINALQPVLGIHVPRRHGVQPRLAEPDDVPRARTSSFDVDGLRACGAAVDDRARDLGADGAVPVAGDRAALLRLPHARPRLRQSRRAADGDGHRL